MNFTIIKNIAKRLRISINRIDLKNIFITIIQIVLIYIPIAIVFLGVVFLRLFGVQDIDNIIATIKLGGIYSFDQMFISTITKIAVITPIIFSIIIYILNKSKSILIKTICYFLCISFAITVAAKLFIGNIDTDLSKTWTNLFSDNYIRPNYKDYNQQHPGYNLIVIYSESTEKEYKNPEILRLLNDTTKFMEDFKIYPLINKYTIGAIVSTRCAAPLFLGAFNQNFAKNSPFQDAICLDDVLNIFEYSSEMYLGHISEFSGIGNFFNLHGKSNVYDSRIISPLYPETTPWHTNDDNLLDFAYKKINELHANHTRRFNATILTMDNHAPNGIPSKRCINEYGNLITKVIQCNSDTLAKFITKLHESGILKDTVLLVMGDHPFMGKFPSLYDDRQIFAKIYNPKEIKLEVKTLTQFDLAPTLLDAVGITSNGKEFGLGISGYNKKILSRSTNWSSSLLAAFNGTPPNKYLNLHSK